MTEPVLKGRNLVKRYGRVTALDNCTVRSAVGRPVIRSSACPAIAVSTICPPVEKTSSKGSRVVKAHDFFRGLFTVDLAGDEIIVSVQFTPVKSAAYAKLFPKAAQLRVGILDPVLDRLTLPVARALGRGFARLRLLQQGRLQIYMLYFVAIVILLLLWGGGTQ